MSVRSLTQPRLVLSTLLIAGAALFTIGVAAERHATNHHTESGPKATRPAASPADPPAPTGAASGDADGGEATTTTAVSGDADGGAGTVHTDAPGGEASGHSETSAETVLGVNLESNGLVAFAVVISLALAVLTWRRSRRTVLYTTLIFALVFVVFDVAEVAHQIKESRGRLATLAAAIAFVHLTTSVVAQQRATTERAKD